MDKYEFVKNSIGYDSSSFGLIGNTSAAYVNPDIWNRQLLDHEKSNIVVTQFAKVYNDLLNAPGETLNVTIDAEPTAASALTESVIVPIDTLSFTQVTFTPTEYGAAYQVTDKEARRSFFDLMQNITKKLGYRLALKKEKLAISLLQTSAGNSINANGVVTSDITTSDTLDSDDIINAKKELKKDKYTPKQLIVAVEQEASLMKLSDYKAAYAFGGREVIYNGMLGHALGLDIFSTDLIAPSSSKAKAIMLGVNGSGEESFGICNKALPTIRTQRWERDRVTDFVAVEEYDLQVLHANGICTIQTYAA